VFPPLSNLHNFFSKLGAKIDSMFPNKPLFLVHSPPRFTTTVHKAACYVWKDDEKMVCREKNNTSKSNLGFALRHMRDWGKILGF